VQERSRIEGVSAMEMLFVLAVGPFFMFIVYPLAALFALPISVVAGYLLSQRVTGWRQGAVFFGVLLAGLWLCGLATFFIFGVHIGC
jgi:hypothetical protein